MDELQSIAQRASVHFTNKEYDKAHALYQDLKQRTNSTNKEVLMNVAITEYHMKGTAASPAKLIEDLNTINAIQSPAASTSAPNTPTTPSATAANEPGSPTSSDLSTPSNSSSGGVGGGSELENDSALISYNQAVLLISMKQPTAALAILETLYASVLFLDDYVAIRVCLLFVQVAVTLGLHDRAYQAIVYAERAFSHLFYTKDTPSNATGDDDSKDSASAAKKDQDQEDESLTWGSTQMTSAEFRFLIHYNKARLLLAAGAPHANLAKDEIAAATARAMRIDQPLQPACHLLKAHYYMHNQNASKSAASMASARDDKDVLPPPGTDKEPVTHALAIGADLHMEELTPQLFLSNMGCINFALNRHVPAIFYLNKALKETGDNLPEVFYNNGVALMISGRPELAFSCMQEAATQLHNSPLVWLRLAECCVLAHLQKLAAEDASNPPQVSVLPGRIVLPVTSGLHRGLQIEDSDVSSIDSTDSGEDAARMGTLSLEFAAKALRNAHYLQSKVMRSIKAGKGRAASSSSSASPPTTPTLSAANSSGSAAPSPTDLYQTSSVELLLSILTSQAYIALCTANPVVALNSTRELIQNCDEKESSHDKFR
eukprot:gene5685-6569_t